MSYLCYKISAGGHHGKPIRIESTDENLCAFVARIKLNERYVITDLSDNFVLDTIGNFFDRCMDKDLLQRLGPIITPYQMGEVAVPNVKYIDNYNE